MPDAAETGQDSSEGQGSGPILALLPPGAPFSGLTPAQHLLRRLVLDSVTAPISKLAYGRALDHLFSFAAGRPLTRALLQEWKADMEGLAPSSINVRLSAVRKLIAEARRNGMLGVEEAANLSDIPNIRQQGTRLGNWITREQAKELLAVPIAHPSKESATMSSWPSWSDVRCAGRSSPPSTSKPSRCGRAAGS